VEIPIPSRPSPEPPAAPAAPGVVPLVAVPGDRRLAARPDPGWLGWAARLGYSAKGVVYLGMGVLAIGVAVGLTQEAAGSRRVLELVATLPFGRWMTGVLAIGLLGYAALSIVAAVEAPEGRRLTLGNLVARIADAVTGVVYLGLTVVALKLIAIPDAIGDVWGEQWLVSMLATPVGGWLTTVGGLVLVGMGSGFAFKAVSGRFDHVFDRRLLGRTARRALVALARVGSLARGVAFGFLGLLLLGFADGGADRSALLGLGAALGALGDLRAGPLLLAVVGLGFVAYGLYQIGKARFRRLRLS
jgi:hypothetical protein